MGRGWGGRGGKNIISNRIRATQTLLSNMAVGLPLTTTFGLINKNSSLLIGRMFLTGRSHSVARSPSLCLTTDLETLSSFL